jgi:hypothetical protein
VSEQNEPINAEFATWYREFSIGTGADSIRKRWEGICEIGRSADVSDLETLVRLAFQTKAQPTSQQVLRIRQPFQQADELFGVGNDREVEVLAAATLCHIASSELSIAPTAAMIVTTTACAGLRATNLPVDLVGKCERALSDLARKNRIRPTLPTDEATDPEAAAANVENGIDYALLLNVFRVLRVQDEELQMLWWLTGERSSTLDSPFSSVNSGCQPLVFSRELADMTLITPGPVSIKGMLQRAGIKANKKGGIVNAVNACQPNWLQPLVDGRDPSPVSAPIHFAVKRKLETNDETSWVPGWAAATGIKADGAIPGLAVANQFYRERLILSSTETP